MFKPFRPGDKVVCIDASNLKNIKDKYKLTYGTIYNVAPSSSVFNINIFIKINNIDIIYYSSRFILLKDYRKQKLYKLSCSIQEIK